MIPADKSKVNKLVRGIFWFKLFDQLNGRLGHVKNLVKDLRGAMEGSQGSDFGNYSKNQLTFAEGP